MRRFLSKLSYANVTATIALFIALGGSSYAAFVLPRDSVGSKQIRKGAVRSSEIRDRSIALRDISRSTRKALRGQQGPSGPPGSPGAPAAKFFAAVTAAGSFVRGNATSGGRTGVGTYAIGFAQDVSGCVYSATLGTTDAATAPPGRITVNSAGANAGVETFDAAGTPADLPFHLLVAC
jgi:hypothetical protein